MLHENKSIHCPHCGGSIDVNEAIYKNIQSQVAQENQTKLKALEKEVEEKREEYKKHFLDLEQKQKALEFEKNKMADEVQKGIQSQLNQERLKLRNELKDEVQKEHSQKEQYLQKELEQKTKQLSQMHELEVKLLSLEREKAQIESKVKIDLEKRLQEQLLQEQARISQQAEAAYSSKLKEKDIQLKQLHNQLVESQRKLEQGSMQLQGESQELLIEDYLRSKFPLDSVDEVKKGARGADCLQHVNTHTAVNCGTIYYESKSTQNFSQDWIAKFKKDMVEKNADIGVFITKTMPKDMDSMGMKDGIWICTFAEFKLLSYALREAIINLDIQKRNSQNVEGKMAVLYNYLTSNEFRLSIENIIISFSKMKESLDKEKRAVQKLWKEREKQIEAVIESTSTMYGSLQGIAGAENITNIKALEFEEM